MAQRSSTRPGGPTARKAATGTESSDATAARAAEAIPTRERILRAAERLFAERGIGATSTRAILQAAEQRNESALQYHFGGREGLIEALWVNRGSEVNTERTRMLDELLEQTAEPTVRQLCEVAVLPAIRLARRDPGFARFLKVVGQMAFLPSERIAEVRKRYEFGSIQQIRTLLCERLDLPATLAERRLDLLGRMAATALSQRARTNESFEGPDADLYFATVFDAMAAFMVGPVSEETASALEASRRGS